MERPNGRPCFFYRVANAGTISCSSPEVEFQLRGAEEVECHAVVGCGAVEADGGAVCGGGVALVAVPGVGGVLVVDGEHVVVAVGLGQDGGGCYAHVLGIAFDDGVVGGGAVGDEAVAVDDDVCGAEVEPVECPVHGGDAGAEDVEAVYLVVVEGGDGPGEGFLFNEWAEGGAAFGGELLGVVEGLRQCRGAGADVRGEDDGGGIDGAGEAAASGFVASGFGEGGGVAGTEHGVWGGGVFGALGIVKSSACWRGFISMLVGLHQRAGGVSPAWWWVFFAMVVMMTSVWRRGNGGVVTGISRGAVSCGQRYTLYI